MNGPVPNEPRRLELQGSVLGARSAPPCLLLHGITASRRYWLPRVGPLARRYRLFVPDLPGFGRSPKPDTDYTMDFFCETLLGYLERHDLAGRPLRLVGHSLGALLCLELAAREPQLADRLVLLDTPRFASAEEAHEILLRGSPSYRNLLGLQSFRTDLAQMRRVGLRRSLRQLFRLPLAVYRDWRLFTFRSLTSTLENCLMDYRLDPLLHSLPDALPRLWIHGTHDQVAPLECLQGALARAPRERVHVIEGAGHHPIHTHTRTCLALVSDFLGV